MRKPLRADHRGHRRTQGETYTGETLSRWLSPCVPLCTLWLSFFAVENQLRKHFWIGFRSECVVQTLDHLSCIPFFDHEGEIDFGSALRNHANLHVFKNAEDLGGDPGGVAQILAHQADDRLPPFVLYVREFRQIGGQRRDGFVGLGRDRDADFGGGHHVHRDLVPIEGLKDGFQISAHQQTARRGYFGQRDFFLERDGLENIRAARSSRRDLGAFAGRVQRVQNIDGNVLLNRGQHGCGMEDLGSEVGEFGGFVKADDLDASGLGSKTGVGGHHAVDVGPDFDALGIEGSAKNRGREIGAAAADGGGDAGTIGGKAVHLNPKGVVGIWSEAVRRYEENFLSPIATQIGNAHKLRKRMVIPQDRRIKVVRKPVAPLLPFFRVKGVNCIPLDENSCNRAARVETGCRCEEYHQYQEGANPGSPYQGQLSIRLWRQR